MISKRIERTTTDRIKRLAFYIADAKEDGEKLEHFWIANCAAGQSLNDLEAACLEMETVQAMNSRTRKDKTYHLVVSFGAQKPSRAAVKDIAKNMAKALGFEDHQYIVGTHDNTDNHHMHIAFNKIHPEHFKIHHPTWDYYKRDRVCRAMEKKWNLYIDKGMETRDRSRSSSKSHDFESHRWEESFDRAVRAQKEDLITLCHEAQSWEDLHKALAERDLILLNNKRGLAFCDPDGLYGTKASGIDASLSRKELTERLGNYRLPAGFQEQQAKDQASFEKRLTARKDGLLQAVEKAKDWQSVHSLFRERSLRLVKRGNGLSIQSRDRKLRFKASALHRSLSLPALQERFGDFVAEERPKRRTTRKPLIPHRLNKQLWNKFLPISRKEHVSSHKVRTFKLWLNYEALSDPLAAALMMSCKRLFAGLDTVAGDSLGAIRAAKPFVTKPVFIDIPDHKKDQARRMRAKWDKEQKLWSVQDDNHHALRRYKTLDLEEVEASREEERRARKERLTQQAARTAYAIWKNADWATEDNCPLFKAQGMPAYLGLKADKEGRLIVSLRDSEGSLQSLQIHHDGTETLLDNARKEGLFHAIGFRKDENGLPKAPDQITVTESIQSAIALYKNNGGLPVVAASGNLTDVSEFLREKYPEAKITLAPDELATEQKQAVEGTDNTILKM